MNTEIQSDADLVSAVAGGDMNALGQLVHRHQDVMLALAMRILGDDHLARDVVQEAFLKVHHAAPRYRPEARFTTWMYRIVTNLCLDEARRAKRSPDMLVGEPPGEEPADPLDRRERIDMVRNAVAALPDRQRVALILNRYHGLSHKQIAETTGWTASAVESLLVRAYESLRNRLADLQEN